MNKKRTHSDNLKKKGRYNPWKWAFVILLLFNLFIGGYLLSFLLSPQDHTENDDSLVRKEEFEEPYNFKVEVSSVELSQVMNDYIDSISEGNPTLTVSIDEYINVAGVTDFLTFEIPYRIRFTPSTLENGNLKLDVVDFEISNLSIPVSFVMNVINRQLDWPEWITINPENESVLIMFDQLIIDGQVQILVENVDLKNDDIRFEVLVNNENLFPTDNKE